MSIIPLLTFALTTSTPSISLADPVYPTTYVAPAFEDLIALADLHRAAQLQALQDEGVALRDRDGGALTRAHRAELQTKLNEIEAAYRAALYRYDPSIVDAFGRRR